MVQVHFIWGLFAAMCIMNARFTYIYILNYRNYELWWLPLNMLVVALGYFAVYLLAKSARVVEERAREATSRDPVITD